MECRPCREDERESVHEIVNAAAVAYRGAIPADRWREPYMSRAELDREVAAGVDLWCCEEDGRLLGVIGIQRVEDVDLIRHAYVRPESQRRGVGAALLETVRRRSTRRTLVGTWRAADWAISFYERHGFELVPTGTAAELLERYWTIPRRQIEESVVLADPPLPAETRPGHPDRA